MGRPTKYDPEKMIPIILDLMNVGASKTEVACALGITRETMNQWEKDPEKEACSDAIKQGELLSQTWWEREGRINLKDKDFSSTLWYMNMKNRFGWADKQEVKQQVTQRDISSEPLDDDNWEQQYSSNS
jgi:DNA-binding XRE family transcriptional regulator